MTLVGMPVTRPTALIIAVLCAVTLIWFGHGRGWLGGGEAQDPVTAILTQEPAEGVPSGVHGLGEGVPSGAHEPAEGVPLPAASAGMPSVGEVVVHVRGNVRRPGVIRLPPGSRVIDALTQAGGVRPGRRIGPLNLARVLVDGEQLDVIAPRHRRVGQPGADDHGSLPSVGEPATDRGTVRLNSATAAELETLPGVGPVLAERILAWRQQHRGFTSVEQLTEVAGIGPARLADIRPRVSL